MKRIRWIQFATAAIAAFLLFAACSAPRATPIPPPTPVPTPVSYRDQILELFLSSEGRYLTSPGYLELAGININLDQPNECVRPLHVWVYDDKGNLTPNQKNGFAFVYGSYALVSAQLIPEFPDDESISVSVPPGATEEQRKAAEEIKAQIKAQLSEQLERFKKYRIELAVSWGKNPNGSFLMQALEIVKIEDAALKKELKEAGLVILKRLPYDPLKNAVETPACSQNLMRIGDSAFLETFDLLVGPGYTSDVEFRLVYAPVKGNYMILVPKQNAEQRRRSYYQGSATTADFVSPIFAFDKVLKQFVIVGITVTNGGESGQASPFAPANVGEIETRGVFLHIEYFLDLMKRTGLIEINASSATPSPAMR